MSVRARVIRLALIEISVYLTVSEIRERRFDTIAFSQDSTFLSFLFSAANVRHPQCRLQCIYAAERVIFQDKQLSRMCSPTAHSTICRIGIIFDSLLKLLFKCRIVLDAFAEQMLRLTYLLRKSMHAKKRGTERVLAYILGCHNL